MLQGTNLAPETAMVHTQNDTAYPAPEAPAPSCSAKREAIQRANAEYLVSHGLHPVDGADEPTAAPSRTVKLGANRSRRVP
jgi:hypothetical protein